MNQSIEAKRVFAAGWYSGYLRKEARPGRFRRYAERALDSGWLLVGRSKAKPTLADSLMVGGSIGAGAGLGVALLRWLATFPEAKRQFARPDLKHIDTDTIKTLPVLHTKADLKRYFGRVPLPLRFVNLKPDSPAAFYASDSDERQPKGLRAYVLPGKTVPELVYKHEAGHAAQDIDPNAIKRRPLLSMLLSLPFGGKDVPVVRHEADAWNRAGVPEDDPLRRAALNTYVRIYDAPRTVLAGAIAGLGIAALLRGRK